MGDAIQEELTDAVFRAALEPDAWVDVMRLMNDRFPSAAQTFYFLHREPRRVRPVCLTGVGPRWVATFDALYFAPDNPWIRLTGRLHRPGVVRTNERLARLLNDGDALYRSSYYNEWMRPQGFKYTIGNTLLADQDIVANITLLRAPDMPTFGDAEVRDFGVLSQRLTRSLQMAVRLERAESSPLPALVVDALPHAVALVDAHGRVVHANAAMEALVREHNGLALRHGSLQADQPADQAQLRAMIAAATRPGPADIDAPASLVLRGRGGGTLTLHAVPVAGAIRRYLPAMPIALVTATAGSSEPHVSTESLRCLHGCTRSEARLVSHLVTGRDLRSAARAMGITYGTARVYLKLVFEKLGVHSQAQLVARVLGPHPASASSPAAG